jgi:predicted AAA+ superfamily ATPase
MPAGERDLLDGVRLPPALEEQLRAANPWWEGRPGRVLPGFHRWAYKTLLRKLDTGLAPVVLLRGARQVGKTTLLEQVIEHLVHERSVEPRRILRVQFDELPSLRRLEHPLLSIAHWFENRVLGVTLNEAAHHGTPAYLFFDEAQNLPEWAAQVKSLVDHHTVHVVVTGSSALRIEAGRDSLAGRVTPLDLGTLLLREIAGLRFGHALDPLIRGNGLEDLLRPDFWRQAGESGTGHEGARDAAFAAFSERGGYPMAQVHADVPWPEVADQLNETVIRRVIQHDLRIGERGRRRDPQLLEEMFRLCCRYAGQAPRPATFISEVQQVLRADIGWQRLRSYLQFLDGSLLVRVVRPLEQRLKKARGAAKLCIVDHGLRQSWLEEIVPLDPARLEQTPHLADLAGHIAESVVGSYLAGIPHLDLAHFPERPVEPEVDFVLTIGERRIPVEVKYRRRIDPHRDTVGLRSFLEKTHYNAPFAVLVTMLEDAPVADPRIIPLSLRALLLAR